MQPATWPFKILVSFATRGRPERFKKGLTNIYAIASQPQAIYTIVIADEDDPTMNNPEIRDFVSKLPHAEISYGVSKNKIDATNRGFKEIPERFNDWSILANFSDDMEWTLYGWDDCIRTDFNQVSPDFTHYISYLDPDTHGALSTLYIAGRRFVEHFGFVYDPMFVSLFADNLAEDAAKLLGKFHYTGYSIYRHRNPAYGYTEHERDAMFEEQQTIGWDLDMKTYYALKEKGLDKYIQKFGKL